MSAQPLTIEYARETEKISADHNLINYRHDTQFIALPISVTNPNPNDAIVVNSRLVATTVSPMATLFIGHVEFPLEKIPKNSEIRPQNPLRIEVSYERLKQIENERRELASKGKRADLTMSIRGTLLFTLGLPFHYQTIQVMHGKSNFVTILDTDWNEVLETLGFPKKRQILVEDSIFKLIEEYKRLTNEPNLESAIEQAFMDAIKTKRSKQQE